MRSSDISVFHNGFFFLFITIKSAQEKFCIWLTKKKVGVCIQHLEACVAPPDIQICLPILSLKVSSCPFPICVMRVGVGGSFCSQWPFLYFIFFLFSLLPENYNLILFIGSILTLVLILMIFNFWTCLFCRNFICF